jgi:hypothetical protein
VDGGWLNTLQLLFCYDALCHCCWWWWPLLLLLLLLVIGVPLLLRLFLIAIVLVLCRCGDVGDPHLLIVVVVVLSLDVVVAEFEGGVGCYIGGRCSVNVMVSVLAPLFLPVGIVDC